MHPLVIHCFHIAELMLQKISSIIRSKDCMKRFSKNIRENAAKIINHEKKEMIPLTYEENRSYKKQ